MRIACVNQDSGIQPERKKGAAVHLREMRRSFEALGADVIAIDDGDARGVRTALRGAWDEGPIDMVYERYALGAKEGAEFAIEREIPHVLEVNTPLIFEEERWRGPVAPETHDKERLVFRNASLITAVTSEVADYVMRHGVETERVHVFANGVDTDRFRPRGEGDSLRRELVPEGRFALGFHGRLRGWHGFDRLARAAGEMLGRGLPLHLVLVGEGDFEKALEGNVGMDRVTRLPWVDHDEIPRYVACFDALPLTYDPEAPCYFSPLKLAEAMACGVVPVVPRMGDLTRVVEDGRNGLIFAGEDLESFQRAVELLVLDPDTRRRLSAGAVETAAAMSWKRIASFILERAVPR